MKWFKHDSNANTDAKLKKLRLKYGMEGYGLYFFCLELIAANVESHNLTFELEHDSELIAADTNIHRDRIEEMMAYMVDLGLFEQGGGGIITCLKMSTRTDEYIQKIIRKLGNGGHTPDTLRTISGQAPDKVPPIRRDRRDRRDGAKPSRFVPPSLSEAQEYISEKKYTVDANGFIAFYQSKNWMVGKNKMKCWKSAITGWHSRNKTPESEADGGTYAI